MKKQMNNPTTVNPSVDDTSTHEVQVDYYIGEIKRWQQQMADDREEILKLQVGTRAILDDITATLKFVQFSNKRCL